MIEPDSVTYYELEPFTRPVAGGNVYSYNASRDGATTQNIKDDGRWGAHFGSGLSTLGGSIRAGEITGNTPIRHAIKIEFDAQQLWRNTIDPHQSYRYPADNTDSNTDGYGVYNTSNPALCMGSLLAIPPSISLESLNLKTCQAKKIFFALQNYGAYIVDTTGDGYKPNGGYSVTICAEKSVIDSEFSFEGSATLNADWFNDFKQLLKSIKVVDSNTQHSIGGGGTPRQPLAPPFNN